MASGLRRAIPEWTKPALRGAANLLDPLARAAHRARGGDRVPPRPLRASVGQPSPSRYQHEGELVAAELRALLAAHAEPLEHYPRILDLASGPGKVLTRLELGPGSDVTAVDVNREAIAWLQRRLPQIAARAERPLPPTSLPRGSFELIFSISLFTHLPEDAQLAWLGEVRRLLCPGGLALITVHGPEAYAGFRAGRRPGISPAQLAALRRLGPLDSEGFAFEAEPNPARRAPGVGSTWGLAFHSAAYVRERWGEQLEIEAVIPAAINFSQDAVLARRAIAIR